MLKFPFYTFGSFLLLVAIVGIIISTISIYHLIKGNKEGDYDTFRNIMGAFVGTIFFLSGSIFSIGNIWSTHDFRSINISQIKAFKVIKSEDEHKINNSKFIIYDDAQSIQNILGSLKNCSETSRNHESYQDGYKLQIIFSDENLEKDFYISVYRKSNNKTGKSVVIPHYYENKNLNLGEYSCSAFQDWIKTNIDPLFNKQSKF